jgi:NADH dehydrogenase
LGVEVRTKHIACRIAPGQVACAGEVHLAADTVVWLAGIRTHDTLLRMGLPLHARGGGYVEPTLVVRGTRNFFAAGDCVYAEDPRTGRTVPDVAYAAIQQGTVVGRNVLRRLRGQPLFSYGDRPRPTLATVGGKYALVSAPPFHFAGRFGWWIKQIADLWYLASILPSGLALRTWLRRVRVRVAND